MCFHKHLPIVDYLMSCTLLQMHRYCQQEQELLNRARDQYQWYY